MPHKPASAQIAQRKASAVALRYGVVAAAYIIASSMVLGEAAVGARNHALIETLKGIGFVAVTAVALGFLVFRDYRALLDAKAQLAASATALARAQNAATLSVVAGAVAHDMRNLVGAALTNLELVAGSSRGDPDEGEALADVRESLRRLSDLASELMTRAGKTGLDQTTTDVDLSAVLASCVRVTSLFAPGHKCDIDTAVEGACTVRARQEELECVVLNLLLNALDANERRGRISVACVRSGASVTVRVKDEGPGVPAHLIDKIFDPFFTTKGAHGNGIGLSVTRGLARSYGGEVRLSSPGPGAEFEVRLPAAS